ncbi:unnamed protein product [Orchesella dallaii]|uniref:Gustatory receptor n=1 Tax=Orchesella dallaii TaxID=48710 RepID=A0ABP1RJ64_9HEXA
MLVHDNIMKYVTEHLKQQEIIGTSPFTFSTDLKLNQNRSRGIIRIVHKVKLYLNFASIIILWLQLLHESNAPLMISLKSTLYAVGVTVACVTKWNVEKQSPAFVELSNLLLQFERRQITGQEGKTLLVKPEKRLIKLVISIGMVSAPVIVPAYILEWWITPCTSATIGYFLFPECRLENLHHVRWSLSSKISLFITCIVCIWVYLDSFGTYIFNCTTMSFSQCYALKSYTKFFMRKLCNSSDRKTLLIYRQLQLLNRYYNRIQQDVLVIAVLYITTAAFVIGNYALITLGRDAKVHELFLFVSTSADTFMTNIVYFGVLAKVYTNSEDAIGSVKEKLKGMKEERRKKWARKYLRSLAPLKVAVGSVNYVDQLTPFHLFNFYIDQTVNLLLMQ